MFEILFRDIFSVFNSPEAAKALQSLINTHCSLLKGKIDVVSALESRGFLFGPQIALELQVPFVPIRKQGKLPGEIAKISFELEYGTVSIIENIKVCVFTLVLTFWLFCLGCI